MRHSKKIIVTISLLLLSSWPLLFATGAGIQLSGKPGLLINEDSAKLEQFTGRATGTIKSCRLPLVFGFGLEAGKNYSEFNYGISGFVDYHALELQLENTWNFYSGFGAEGSLLTRNFENCTFTAGARFFAGMNWLFYDNYLEFYLQQNVVPAFSKMICDSKGKEAFILGLPFEAGIRMHF